MATALYEVVVPPDAPAPRGPTLLRSVNIVDPPNDRWIRGLTWRPLACGDASTAQAVEVCGTFSGWEAAGTDPTAPQYVPPHVQVALACSGISGETVLLETFDRAVALLDRCQTLGIARELWTGTAAQSPTPDLPNDYLNRSADIDEPKSTTAQGVIRGLAELEGYIAECSCAGGGVIHATVRTATYWARMNLVNRQPDGRLLTALGTVVVADPGYDGSAPGGAVDATHDTDWAYATGMVDVRLGPVLTSPPRGEWGQGVSRTNNNFTVFAHRPFAATFDPCCRAGVKISHTTLT